MGARARGLLWAARLLALLMAGLLTLFSLDSFVPGRPLGENLLAFEPISEWSDCGIL